MITLTTPIQVPTTLGSSAKTNFDRLDLTTINYDVVNKSIGGACALIASGAPTVAPIQGTYNIPTNGSAVLTVSIPMLLFVTNIALTTAQQAAVQGWISSAQNTVEAGLVSVGVVAGTQASGS